jgi:alpha-galactosidase
MLLGSDTTTARYLTPTQSRTQFSLWAVMAAPLLIGANPSRMSAFDLQTYANKEVIAVNQDVLGVQVSF